MLYYYSIISTKNTALKRPGRFGKEKEVGEKTLEWLKSEWLKSGRARKKKISLSAIQRKASEIGGEMGKNFSPSR